MDLDKIKREMLTEIYQIITESDNKGFDEFPPNILDTLESEYSYYYQNKFDWNKKVVEFGDDQQGFKEWAEEKDFEVFNSQLNTIITKVRQDLILLIKKENAKNALEKFEQLIIPVLGNSVLCKPLSKFMEKSLLNLHSAKEIGLAFAEADKIIDSNGSLNTDKIEQSDIFSDMGINLPQFEDYVEKNPEYQGVFDDWERLFNKHTELLLKDLNAYRNSISIQKVRELYYFLVTI